MAERHEGPYGWAERIELGPGSPGSVTTLVSWFMHLPNQGLGWDDYLLCLITLADVAGYPPANKRYPEAEYEVLVTALDPSVNPNPKDWTTWHRMEPVNYVTHFDGISDTAAIQVVDALALACVAGLLPGETQVYLDGKMMLVKQLVDLWDETVHDTVHHYRTGGHHGQNN